MESMEINEDDGLFVKRAKGICLGIKILLDNDVLGMVEAQHDVIYAGNDQSNVPMIARQMEVLGWHWDEDGYGDGCWAFFT